MATRWILENDCRLQQAKRVCSPDLRSMLDLISLLMSTKRAQTLWHILLLWQIFSSYSNQWKGSKNSLHSWKSQQCSFTVLLYSYETLQFSFQNGLACLGLPKNITLLNYFNNIRLTKQNEQEVSGLPEALMKKVCFRDERQTWESFTSLHFYKSKREIFTSK